MGNPTDELWEPVQNVNDLDLGQIVRHAGGGPSYIVTFSDGEQATAVRTVQITNPQEWLVLKQNR